MKEIALCCLAIAFSTQVWANCNEILKHGIYDETSSFTNESKFNVFKHAFCKDGQLQADIPTEFGQFGISNSSSWCSSSYKEASQQNQYFFRINQINDHIIDAWERCVQQEPTGLLQTVSIKRGSPNLIVYSVSYVPPPRTPTNPPRLVDIRTPSKVITCENSRIDQLVSASGIIVVCERESRDDSGELVIGFNYEGVAAGVVDKKVYIPPYEEQFLPTLDFVYTKPPLSGYRSENSPITCGETPRIEIAKNHFIGCNTRIRNGVCEVQATYLEPNIPNDPLVGRWDTLSSTMGNHPDGRSNVQCILRQPITFNPKKI